jgi:hypothetical protein
MRIAAGMSAVVAIAVGAKQTHCGQNPLLGPTNQTARSDSHHTADTTS